MNKIQNILSLLELTRNDNYELSNKLKYALPKQADGGQPEHYEYLDNGARGERVIVLYSDEAVKKFNTFMDEVKMRGLDSWTFKKMEIPSKYSRVLANTPKTCYIINRG